MAKVKIVQIAIAASSDNMGGSDSYAEYLDDKGRIWYQVRKVVESSGVAGVRDYEYVWQQLDLPDEPEA